MLNTTNKRNIVGLTKTAHTNAKQQTKEKQMQSYNIDPRMGKPTHKNKIQQIKPQWASMQALQNTPPQSGAPYQKFSCREKKVGVSFYKAL